jgi:type IV pilus assembly protein PilE
MQKHTNALNRAGLHRQRGVTLLELMIVVVIVAIVASIAFPSYTQYIIRAKRNAAKSVILQVADRQEQFFADNKQYATTMTALGFDTNPFAIDENGGITGMTSAERLYSVSLTNTGATTFTVLATPELSMTRDGDCGVMSMTHTGVKGNSGSSTDCW